MRNQIICAGMLLLGASLPQDMMAQKKNSMNNQATKTSTQVSNPLLADWSGPYGGVPPLDRVKVDHFKPALETAMEEQLAEIHRIVMHAAPANFENTIAALERSGKTMDRVTTVYGIWSSTMNDDAFQ